MASPSDARKRRRARTETPMQVLADPETWRILRKLIAHADFRAQVHKLAADYPDPEE